MPKTKYVLQWLERANDDLDSATLLVREGGSPSIVCFLTQQAAEKYLKAFLAFSEQHVRKIHDLEKLVLLCAEFNQKFSSLREDAIYLTNFYIATRYPADIPQFTKQDAASALAAAERIKEFVAKEMG